MENDIEFKLKPKKISIFKIITFQWVNPVLSIISKRSLELLDLPPLVKNQGSELNTNCLSIQWKKEIIKEKPSLVRALGRTFVKENIIIAVLLFLETCCTTYRPIIIRNLLGSFMKIKEYDSMITSIIKVIELILITAAGSIMRNAYFWAVTLVGIRVRLATSGLLLEKMMTLNQKTLLDDSVGNFLNLFSTDVQRLEMVFFFIHAIYMAPLQGIVILWLIYNEGGVAAIIGVLSMLLLAGLQTLPARILSKLKAATAQLTDRRVKMVNELIGGIHILKIFTWEELFSKRLQEVRRKECDIMMKQRWVQGIMLTQIMCLTKLAMLLILITLYFLHPDDPTVLLSEKIFTIYGLILALLTSVTINFPFSVQFLFENLINCRRIQIFLTASVLGGEMVPTVIDSEMPMVQIDKACATWNNSDILPNKLTLDSIKLNISGPKLIAIIGPVGSGKSSLLQAVLGELPLADGTITRSSSITYSPQTPWVFMGSVRENILSGQPFDLERYRRVLRATTLNVDLRGFPKGDASEVGERGISLSGGQKARVGLARLAYAKTAGIVCLDDPLAAVDAKVGNEIFTKCICGLMSDRLRLLVTNQHHLLQHMDAIVVIVEGKVVAFGTHTELLRKGINFSELTQKTDEEVKSPIAVIAEEPSSQEEYMDADSSSIDEEYTLIHNNDNISSFDSKIAGFSTKISQEYSRFHKLSNNMCEESLIVSSNSLQKSRVRNDSSAVSEDFSALECNLSGPFREINDAEPDRITETSNTGNIRMGDYVDYLTIGAGWIGLIVSMILYLISLSASIGFEVILSDWTNFANDRVQGTVANTTETNYESYFGSDQNYMISMGVISAILVLFTTIRSWFFLAILTNAARRMHNSMLRGIISTRMQFFQFHTVGQIINRFSKDIGQVDELMAFTFADFLQMIFNCFGVLVITAIGTYWSLIPIIPLLIVLIFYRNYYIKTSRELKRIESVARSPVFGHLTTTSRGLPSLRATKSEASQFLEYHRLMDEHSKVYYFNMGANRWLAIRLDAVCVIFIAVVSAMCIIIGVFSDLQPGTMAVMLISQFSLIGVLQWALRQSTEVENQMVAIERMKEYMSVEPEEAPFARVNAVSKLPYISVPSEWPSKGAIRFENIWLQYTGQQQWALQGIDLDIKAGCKLGIIGRTGAGKSSLISLLFRLVEVQRGRILIDGIDASQLRLASLRKRISIIPQDPLLFSGTVRDNLDPDGRFGDNDLWRALKTVQLKQTIEQIAKGLDGEIVEGGGNLSTGQRQLFSLARAILQGNKILLIDEATANVDPTTDTVVQQTIRTEFADNTVLTIAHRLNTIIDSDEVIVMEAGRVVERGRPYSLLDPSGSANLTNADDGMHGVAQITSSGPFAAMVLQTGEQCALELVKQAKQKFMKSL